MALIVKAAGDPLAPRPCQVPNTQTHTRIGKVLEWESVVVEYSIYADWNKIEERERTVFEPSLFF